MLTLDTLTTASAFITPASPLITALLLACSSLSLRTPSKRLIAYSARLSLFVSLLFSLFSLFSVALHHGTATTASYGTWFTARDYSFDLSLRVDLLSASLTTLATTVALYISFTPSQGFHPDYPSTSYFSLLCAFSSGVILVTEASGFDLLFAGWELTGLIAPLLAGDHSAPTRRPRATLTMFVTFSVCDLGLPAVVMLLHPGPHSATLSSSTVFSSPAPTLALASALCILLAASARAAQIPVGVWLPRALRDTSPSGGLFFSLLSIQTSVYLLLRTAPLFHRSAFSTAALLTVGATTVVYSLVVGRAQNNPRDVSAYSTMAHAGAMFISAGLGLTVLTLALLFIHTVSLCWPRAFSTSRILTHTLSRSPRRTVSPALSRVAYGLAYENFYLEELYLNLLTLPLLRFAERLDALERRLTFGPTAHAFQPPTPPAVQFERP